MSGGMLIPPGPIRVLVATKPVDFRKGMDGLETAKTIRYGLRHWDGLTRRIELDTNIVERSMRPQALTRKNALFAGHDDGAENWAILASLIETAKLSGIDPQAWLADILARLVNLWPNNRLDELLPWPWAAAREPQRRAA
jgi:transposase